MNSSHSRFAQLRAKHKSLTFDSFDSHFDNNTLVVGYAFTLSPDISIRNEVRFPDISEQRYKTLPRNEMDNLFFQLGMGELMLMWRFACPQKLIISTGYLSTFQLSFWKKLFREGFGEFYFKESINFNVKDFLVFSTLNKNSLLQKVSIPLRDRDLLLTTGGKDSAVTLDILSRSDREVRCLMIDPTKAALNAAKLAHVSRISVTRNEDKKLPGLVHSGYFNGHTPYTAYLALVACVAAVLYDYKNVIVSNEESANEINTTYRGMKINHQYAKSMTVEKSFRSYLSTYISKQINFFSFLRPLKEIQISRIFAGMEKYHRTFKSCNMGARTETWCLRCPKCLSSYLMLYPFSGRYLDHIFGNDFLQRTELMTIMRGLLQDKEEMKPLECVASTYEVRVAIYMSIKKSESEGKPLPALLELFRGRAISDPNIFNTWNTVNFLPSTHKRLLRNALAQTLSNKHTIKDSIFVKISRILN